MKLWSNKVEEKPFNNLIMVNVLYNLQEFKCLMREKEILLFILQPSRHIYKKKSSSNEGAAHQLVARNANKK